MHEPGSVAAADERAQRHEQPAGGAAVRCAVRRRDRSRWPLASAAPHWRRPMTAKRRARGLCPSFRSSSVPFPFQPSSSSSPCSWPGWAGGPPAWCRGLFRAERARTQTAVGRCAKRRGCVQSHGLTPASSHATGMTAVEKRAGGHGARGAGRRSAREACPDSHRGRIRRPLRTAQVTTVMGRVPRSTPAAARSASGAGDLSLCLRLGGRHLQLLSVEAGAVTEFAAPRRHRC